MIGKAHGLKFKETNAENLERWSLQNSGCEIMDIKYAISPAGSSLVLIIYRS